MICAIVCGGRGKIPRGEAPANQEARCKAAQIFERKANVVSQQARITQRAAVIARKGDLNLQDAGSA